MIAILSRAYLISFGCVWEGRRLASQWSTNVEQVNTTCSSPDCGADRYKFTAFDRSQQHKEPRKSRFSNWDFGRQAW